MSTVLFQSRTRRFGHEDGALGVTAGESLLLLCSGPWLLSRLHILCLHSGKSAVHISMSAKAHKDTEAPVPTRAASKQAPA